ncbi:Fe-S cluster-binding ribosome biosynthesis protein, partial [Coemansia sp. RSA 2603]
VLQDDLHTITKPQWVDQLARVVKDSVESLLHKKQDLDNLGYLINELDLKDILERGVPLLSGGELQRFAIAVTCVQRADVYMFDEPSSYLDVKQRLNAARVIRSMLTSTNYVIAVEHDLSVLDYLSDFICVLYGTPSVYGVVTMPYSVREGINIFLDGYIPTENMRIREEMLSFRITEQLTDEEIKRHQNYSYPAMEKTLDTFKLRVEGGTFTDSQVVVLLGENGTGKTTLIRMLAGNLKPDNDAEIPGLHISYKPQKISPKFPGTVRMLMLKKIQHTFMNPQFQTDVVKPMNIEDIIDQEVKNLSGGELQRVALVLALGTPADVYLIDEPVIVMEGTPSVNAVANSPQTLLSGMNKFLSSLNITFRRDPENYRPRINKMDSVKDREQKADGNYFFLED